jgi:enterochelin esterase-like enzyme
LVVFLPVIDSNQINALLPAVEKMVRIRKGYRLRAVAGFSEGAPIAFSMAANPEQFGACIMADAFVTKVQMTGMISATNREAMKRTSIFVDAPCKGAFSEGNGNAHMLLRDKDIQHEYRVREGDGGFNWLLQGLPEVFQFTAKRFHK